MEDEEVDEEEEERQERGDEEMDEDAEESVVDERRKRRRLVKHDSEIDEDADDADAMNDYDDHDDDRSIYSHDEYLRAAPVRKLQSPFQPGAASDANDPWMMAWNLFGLIESSSVDDVTRRIQISFADADARPRIRLTDRFGFSKGSLGKFSALFSSPRKDDSIPATIFYKNFDSWAANSDWSATLPEGEDILAITLIGRNVAVCSDRGILRLMSHSGVHRAIFCLDDAVVCMAGSVNNHLAVITTTASGSYLYVLYQVDKQIRRLGSGSCPVSPDSTISWIGYSEENGLTEPSVTNRPILNGLPFMIPTMLGDNQAAPLEQRYLLNAVMVANHQSMSDIGTSKQKNERKATCSRLSLKQDVTLIELLRIAVNDNNISRALDLATQLSSEKSLNAARKIVEKMGQPMLVERLDLLLRAMFPKVSQPAVSEPASVPASSSSPSQHSAPTRPASPKPNSSTPLALNFSPSPATRPSPSSSLPTPTETPSMKPDFRRRAPLPSQTPARSSGFSSQLDQKRLGGGSTAGSSSRPF